MSVKVHSIALCALLVACGGDDEDRATVYESKQAIQCESTGLTVDESAQKLISAGVDVVSSRCGYRTDVSYPEMCGIPGGEIVIHTIPSQNLPDAEVAGFSSTESIEYREHDCDEAQN